MATLHVQYQIAPLVGDSVASMGFPVLNLVLALYIIYVLTRASESLRAWHGRTLLRLHRQHRSRRQRN